MRDHLVVQLVCQIRKDHPRMGVRKIYHKIKPELERLNIYYERGGTGKPLFFISGSGSD